MGTKYHFLSFDIEIMNNNFGVTLVFKADLQIPVFLQEKRMEEASNIDGQIISVTNRTKLGTLELNDGSQYTAMIDDHDKRQIVEHCSDVLANESDYDSLPLSPVKVAALDWP